MYAIGRLAGETYPEPRSASSSPQPATAFDQNTDAYTVTTGDPPLQIASASITVAAGSRIKIEGLASFDGFVAAGRALLSSPAVATVSASQSFNAADGLNFRTCNYLAVTDPQAGGPVTVALQLEVVGSPGSNVSSTSGTVLILTELQ